MAYYPIALTVPQYHVGGVPASGYVLKAYQNGTSVLLQMATDNTGATLVNSVELNAEGYPEVSGNIIIPHVDQGYKLALYPSQAAAAANSGATWSIDDLIPYNIIANFGFTNNTMSSTNTNGDIILDPNGTGLIRLNATTNIESLQLGGTAVTPDAAEVNQLDGFGLKGYITGFVPTADSDADHDLTFSSGACRNALDTISCKPTWTTLTKQIDAVWAEGDDAGGMATGSVATSTAYYYNLIRKNADTTIFDICIDVSASNANTPSGWTFMREIHKEFTDGSANLRPQTYIEMAGGGIRSKLKTVLTAFTDNDPGVGLVTKTIPCPPSVEVRGSVVMIDSTPAAATYMVFSEVGSASTEPDVNNYTLFVGGTATTQYALDEIERFTDASRNLEYELSSSTADHSIWFQVFSWKNHRRN